MELTRRELLRNSVLLTGAVGAAHSQLSLAGALDAGHWSRDLPAVDPLLHLMNRASFGVTQQMLDAAPASPAEWLEQQLSPLPGSDDEVEAMIARDFPGYQMEFAAQYAYYTSFSSNTITTAQIQNGDTTGMMGSLGAFAENPMQGPASSKLNVNKMATDLQGATFYYQQYSPNQLREVMVDFWSNHFNVFLHSDGNTKKFKPKEDRTVIRPNALGNFHALLRGSASSAAMITYLDTDNNRSGAPNENYARELLELHTLGIEHYHPGTDETCPEGYYTETDIKQIARCFTGWELGRFAEMRFNPDRHDSGNKTVLGVEIQGRDGEDGVEEAYEVLALLAAHPGTARHLARKLAQRFVSDEPPVALVDALAETFLRDGGDIPAMLRTLFGADEFMAARDEKFLRPLDYLHRVLRVLNADLKTNPGVRWAVNPIRLSDVPQKLQNHYLRKEGHTLFGWDTPDGYPVSADHWANPNALLQRWRMAAYLLENHWWTSFVTVDLDSLAGPAETAQEYVAILSQRVLRRSLHPEDQSSLVALAEIELAQSDRDGCIRALLTAMLGSAYFQLY